MANMCCKDCDKRHYACWDSCPDYQAFRVGLDQIRKRKKRIYIPDKKRKGTII